MKINWQPSNLVRFCILATLVVGINAKAQAQDRGNTAQDNRATLPLPYGLDRLIAIDAHNSLIAQLSPQEDDPDADLFRALTVNHIYAGGIARLFGGTVIPSAAFVSPGFSSNGAPQNNNSFQSSAAPNNDESTDQAFNPIFQQGTIRR